MVGFDDSPSFLIRVPSVNSQQSGFGSHLCRVSVVDYFVVYLDVRKLVKGIKMLYQFVKVQML